MSFKKGDFLNIQRPISLKGAGIQNWWRSMTFPKKGKIMWVVLLQLYWIPAIDCCIFKKIPFFKTHPLISCKQCALSIVINCHQLFKCAFFPNNPEQKISVCYCLLKSKAAQCCVVTTCRYCTRFYNEHSFWW